MTLMLENCLQRQPIRLPQELVSTTDVQVTTDTRRPPLCFIPNELGNNTDINLYFRQGSVIVDFYVVLSPNSKMNATEIGNAFTKALLSPEPWAIILLILHILHLKVCAHFLHCQGTKYEYLIFYIIEIFLE